MANLKPLLDAAQAADLEMTKVRDEILRLVDLGTEECVNQATDLRPKLEAAKSKADKANALYASVRDASLVSDSVAPLFAPPPDPAQEAPVEDKPKVMNRADFMALTPADRMAFAKSGGKLSD